jgi:hypothetical protein
MADGTSRGVPFNSKDQQTVVSRHQSEGSSFILVTLPKFGKAVDQGLVSGYFLVPAGFALKGKTRLPCFLNACLRQVFDDGGVLLEDPNPITIFYLRQYLLVNSKLITEFTDDQQDLVVKEFKERQHRLKRLKLPRNHFVLECAKNALYKALRHLDLSVITPGHGPGVVHEGYPKDVRWDFRYWSSQANKVYPFDEYGVQGLEHLRTKSNSVVFLDRMTTRICLVPKDFKGPRLISVEMSGNQYLQQGQMRSIMSFIESSKLLSRSIRLRDQSFNQDMARRACDGTLATLDLSNASDTVTSPLVWFLLSKLPRLRRQLFSTRSYAATWKGESIRLAAFAPMGSATCFPVETLVFWALAIGSKALHRYGRRGSRLSYQDLLNLSDEIAVFGDDIIIGTNYFDTLVATLQAVGCEPNMSKTCTATPFRESCGSEWFYGIDVTIIRNKEYTYDQHWKFSHYPILSGLQRKFYAIGLRRTAELIASWAIKSSPVFYCRLPDELQDISFTTGYPVALSGTASTVDNPLSSDFVSGEKGRRSLQSYGYLDSCLFGQDYQLDSDARVRWNHNLQRTEIRIPVSYQKSRDWGSVSSKETGFVREDYARLLARLLSDHSDRIPIRGGNTKIGWRFLPDGSYDVKSYNHIRH